jgi:hypothetical protein
MDDEKQEAGGGPAPTNEGEEEKDTGTRGARITLEMGEVMQHHTDSGDPRDEPKMEDDEKKTTARSCNLCRQSHTACEG